MVTLSDAAKDDWRITGSMMLGLALGQVMQAIYILGSNRNRYRSLIWQVCVATAFGNILAVTCGPVNAKRYAIPLRDPVPQRIMVGQVLFNIGDSISKIGYIMAAVLRTKAVYRKYTKCLYLLYAAALVGIALILNVNIRFIALSTTPKFINQKMWFQFPTINQFIFASTVYVVIFDMICAFIFCHAIYSNVLGSTTHPLLRIFGSNDIRRLIMSIVFALGHLIIKEVTEQNDMWIVMGTVVLWITYQQTSFVITSYETTAKVFHAADSAAAGGTKPSATSSSGGTATGTEPLARRPIMTRSIDASNC